ncbi:MAG: hypothetical protein E6Q88_07885 [Lysobacteraceae bacterium]|nr:MAG: hypothetical protein E6Q88_07885 [Xanthomonadaceae bacterium]
MKSYVVRIAMAVVLTGAMLMLWAGAQDKPSTVGPMGAEINVDEIALVQGGIGGNGFLEMAKGFNATSAFTSTVNESVDPFSGNLFVSVPLGATFNVGQLSYALGANYNARIWEWVVRVRQSVPGNVCDDDPSTIIPPCHYDQSMPVMTANAGIGWSVGLGELYEPFSSATATYTWPNYSTVDWLYVGPDGKRVELVCDTSYPGANCNATTYPRIYVSADYRIRMRRTSGEWIAIDMPNGETHLFKWQQWNACPGSAQNPAATWCWRLAQIDNQAGNSILASWSNSGENSSDPITVVTDSVGRKHVIHYRVSPTWNSGQTMPCWQNFTPVSPNECGEYNYIVDRVSINAQATRAQVYQFNYGWQDIPRSAPHAWYTGENMDATVQVPFLNAIAGPAGTFTFAHHPASLGAGNRLSGILTSYKLPTLGSVAYTYQDYVLPKPCGFNANFAGIGGIPHFDNPRHTTLPGVASRIESNPTGAQGVASYERDNNMSAYGDTPCARPNWVATTELGKPSGEGEFIETFHAYSVAHSDNGAWRASEYGLPIDKTDSAYFAGLGEQAYFSKRISVCEYPNGGSNRTCAPSRYQYATFASRRVALGSTTCEPGDPTTCIRRATLLTGMVTTYAGESVHTGVRYRQFDGHGTARQATRFSSGFGGSSAERTQYAHASPHVLSGDVSLSGDTLTLNSGFFAHLPGSNTRWVLGRPQYQEVSGANGNTLRTDFCYDNAGLLAGQAVRKEAGGTSEAMVTWITYGAAGGSRGLPTKTITEIATNGGWGTGACTASTTSSTGSIVDSTYHPQGHLATQKYSGIDGFVIERNVDSYGHVTREKTPAGIESDFSYDLAGRLLSANTPGRTGRSQSYTAASGNTPAKTTITRGDITLTVTYDGFGRPISESQTLPDTGTVTTSLTYDAQGSVVEAKKANGATTAKTTMKYDGFGRVIQVVDVDGSISDISYSGDRLKVTKIGSSYTKVENDGFGRPYRTSAGQSAPDQGTMHCTEAAYDLADRLTSEKRYTGACGVGAVQTVTYAYDGRGLVTSVARPEATLTNSDFVATGQPGTVGDGNIALKYTYDKRGRVLTVKDGGSNRLMLEFAYGASGCATSHGTHCLGQLVRKVRHNWDGGVDYAVEQKYHYEGASVVGGDAGGAITRIDTTVNYPNPAGIPQTKTFTQRLGWSGLGQVATTGYPGCSACGAPPERRLSHTYQRGMLTALDIVTGSAGASPVRFADLSYNALGNLSKLRFDYTTGGPSVWTENEFVYKANGEQLDRVRARYLTSTSYFDSGVYAYNALGDVTAIGGNSYGYDRLGRLTSSTSKPNATTTRNESYEYNAFDFLTRITRTHNGGTQSFVDFTPNAKNQIANMSGRASAFVYDGSGNLTNDGCYLYQYDVLGQMISQQPATASPPSGCGLRLKHFYDADGMRILSMCANCQPPTPVPSFTFTATPGTITVGQSATLSWGAVGNASACSASGAWTGSKAITGGSQTVSPAASSTYSLSCTGAGGTTTRSVTITVIPACPAVINTHPVSASVSLGGTAIFQATASGPPTLTYQWRKDGVNIAGANGSSHTIVNAQPAHAGSYTVAVGSTGCSNPAVISNPAALTITSGSAYGGTPWTMPGLVEAENYDIDGQNSAYFDTTPGNVNGHYRNDDVDIVAMNPGYGVGVVAATEWWRYSVYWPNAVAAAASSDKNISAYLRYAALNGANRPVGMGEAVGVATIGNPAALPPGYFPNTAGWTQFRIRRPGYNALTSNHPAGAYRLYVYSGAAGINLDWVRQQLTPDMSQQTTGELKLDQEDNYSVAADAPLAGRQFCANGACLTWNATSTINLIAATRAATANTSTAQVSASVTLPANADHRRVVSASVKPVGSGWMAVGFLKAPTGLFWGGGSVWALVMPSGVIQVFANGHTVAVSAPVQIPATAGFDPNAFNLIELWVDKTSTGAIVAVKAFVNGVSVVDAQPAALSGLSLDYPGWGGSAMTSGGSEVDDFRIQTAKP